LAFLIAVPAVAGASYLVWELHTTRPRVKTPIVIDRSSLLPHRYVGPCLNCHQIRETRPMALNQSNMSAFRLSPMNQRLVLSGQSVQVPSVAQLARVPAITRSDILPHRYVGVCSNCHVVLDIRPTRPFMQRAMRRAHQPLVALGLPAERIARGGAREHHKNELYRNIWGFVALGFFIAGCVYLVMRTLLRIDPAAYKGRFPLKKWLLIHEWSFTGFAISGVLHWYYSERGNNFLHLALLALLWLTAEGYVLRYRLAGGTANRSLRLVHTQQALFIGLVLLLVIGHLFADFEH